MAADTVDKDRVDNQVKTPTLLYKRIVYPFIPIVFGLVFMMGAGELGLRVLPLGRFRSAPFRQYDPELGLTLVPNKTAIHGRGCFQGLVRTNQWGFRDRDRALAKPAGVFRIAVIGDSMVEAVQVRPEQVFNIQMEQMLRDKGQNNVEVLAFGIGGIGTTQELLLYNRYVRQFHPDLVLVMFSDNDVMNNSAKLQNAYYDVHTWYCPYYNLGPHGSLVFQPTQPMHFHPLRMWIESHSLLMHYLERLWFDVDYGWGTWRGVPLVLGVFSDDPLDKDWQDAWSVTEKVMVKMKQAVDADGAKLMLFIWPNQYDTYPDWRQHMIKEFGKIPEGFNPSKFYERLEAIANQANVASVPLAPYFQQYRDAHNLQPPYFSLPCDPHFSALGHSVTAETLIAVLQRQ
jgi:hypothetical protein